MCRSLLILTLLGSIASQAVDDATLRAQAEADVAAAAADAIAAAGLERAPLLPDLRIVADVASEDISSLLEIGRRCGKSEGAVVSDLDATHTRLSWRKSSHEAEWEECVRASAQASKLPYSLFPS